ncbi:MAG: VWA domain-containing protein [Cyanobacteria bacterium]|nr:VWA domain-containing protein [Cyanobacteriota bacterium]
MARLIAGALAPLALLPLLASCGQLSGPSLEITMLVGSALGGFCKEAAAAIELDPPRLPDGTRVLLRCRASGSGDVVSELEGHARAVLQGGGRADDPAIPTLLSVDGEIYQELLRHRLQAIAPGRSLIPPSADAPALATSPMVLMTTPALVKGLQRAKPFLALARADTHQQLDPAGPSQPIRFVQTAPTRSNSGLQTLVAMVSEVSGKRPEQLTLADVKGHAAALAAIQKHVTRYGSSTDELARTMQRNGMFWASVASVYESSVVAANGRREPGQEALVAVYPRATYSSTMRAILPTAPWVSAQERQAALLLIERLQQPALQRLAADQGLRPANPAVPMDRITAAYGADPRAVYDSLRAPSPEVVEAIITSWRNQVKKPSRVALVVDSSGSMNGDKLPSAQRSLQAYLAQTGPRDVLGLIDFDSSVREPVVVRGGRADAAKAMTFVSGLRAEGGTSLYDAVEAGRNWLRRTRRPGEILAVVVLTDGNDSGSKLSLEALEAELRRSGFASDDRIGVFTIGYGSSGNYDAAALRRIAESNGGVFVEGTPDSILKRMEQLQLSF